MRITRAQFDGLDKYKYSGIDKSVLSRHVLTPYWNLLVKAFPRWLAPNAVGIDARLQKRRERIRARQGGLPSCHRVLSPLAAGCRPTVCCAGAEAAAGCSPYRSRWGPQPPASGSRLGTWHRRQPCSPLPLPLALP